MLIFYGTVRVGLHIDYVDRRKMQRLQVSSFRSVTVLWNKRRRGLATHRKAISNDWIHCSSIGDRNGYLLWFYLVCLRVSSWLYFTNAT